jgi:hypothetical protein
LAQFHKFSSISWSGVTPFHLSLFSAAKAANTPVSKGLKAGMEIIDAQ